MQHVRVEIEVGASSIHLLPSRYNTNRDVKLIARCDVCFVAEVDGRVVGYATNYINELASRGTIANLAVSAACQGLGVGRKLMERSIERFRELGLRQAKIETLECNQTGRHLYPSVGFEEVVRQIHYIMPLD